MSKMQSKGQKDSYLAHWMACFYEWMEIMLESYQNFISKFYILI